MLLAPAVLSLALPLSSRLVMGRNKSRQSSVSMRLPSRSDGNATVLMYNNRAVSYALYYRPDARLPPADLAAMSRRSCWSSAWCWMISSLG